MSVKRVAVVSYHSSPLQDPGAGDSGGMTIYVRDLSAALARLGVATDIFTRAAGDVPPVTPLSERVRVVSLAAGPREPLTKERQFEHLDEFVNRAQAFAFGAQIRYDVVHSHYWQGGLAARGLSRVWGVPLVHSHHTLARVKDRFRAPGEPPEPRLRLRGEDEIISAADVLVASTDDEWRYLSCLYGANHDRLKIVHPGVDHELFRPGDRSAARRELGLGSEAVLLYVGRIQPLKGLSLALQSVARLRALTVRKPLLVIVGGPSGPGGDSEVARLRLLAEELEVQDCVRFAGPQPHRRLPLYYRAADCVVVCSHSESFGLAALEAHACGTPVVGTAVGGLSHIVEDGVSGFLLRSRDPEQFARCLAQTVAGGAAASCFRSAAHARAQAFSWDRAARSFLDLYNCLWTAPPELCTC